MKLEKFLKWIQFNLLNYPDISFKTVKMFMDKFEKCLSNKERIRWATQIQIIREFSLIQISLDTFVKNTITDNLINELNNIQKDDNNDRKKG